MELTEMEGFTLQGADIAMAHQVLVDDLPEQYRTWLTDFATLIYQHKDPSTLPFAIDIHVMTNLATMALLSDVEMQMKDTPGKLDATQQSLMLFLFGAYCQWRHDAEV